MTNIPIRNNGQTILQLQYSSNLIKHAADLVKNQGMFHGVLFTIMAAPHFILHITNGREMEPLFRAAKQSRIFQDVVGQIQEAIIDGRLKSGDKLPPERDLRAMLQTSRSTIREALRVLEQKGLIEIKLGMSGGAVVRSVSSEQIAESLDLLIRSQKVSLNHLAEFREGVEGNVVSLAARRACRVDIHKLKELLDTARLYAESGQDAMDDFLKADKKLHLAFAHISGNPVYSSVLKTIHDNMHHYYARFLAMKDQEMQENYQDLCDIVAAVADGEPVKARALAQAHVRRFNLYMKEKENQL